MKKVFLIVGSLLLATTSTIPIISCSSKQQTKKLNPHEDKVFKTALEKIDSLEGSTSSFPITKLIKNIEASKKTGFLKLSDLGITSPKILVQIRISILLLKKINLESKILKLKIFLDYHKKTRSKVINIKIASPLKISDENLPNVLTSNVSIYEFAKKKLDKKTKGEEFSTNDLKIKLANLKLSKKIRLILKSPFNRETFIVKAQLLIDNEYKKDIIINFKNINQDSWKKIANWKQTLNTIKNYLIKNDEKMISDLSRKDLKSLIKTNQDIVFEDLTRVLRIYRINHPQFTKLFPKNTKFKFLNFEKIKNQNAILLRIRISFKNKDGFEDYVDLLVKSKEYQSPPHLFKKYSDDLKNIILKKKKQFFSKFTKEQLIKKINDSKETKLGEKLNKKTDEDLSKFFEFLSPLKLKKDQYNSFNWKIANYSRQASNFYLKIYLSIIFKSKEKNLSYTWLLDIKPQT